jgi:PAS domain S-box-containing protein
MRWLPSSPLHDPARLKALEETGLLSWAPGESFDRLTRFGADVLRVPMTNVTLVEENRQVVLSHAGLPEPWASNPVTGLERSFCQHVVRSGEPLIVEDVRKHPLLRESPLIREAGIVAYSGIPWRTPDGFVQGAFCAMDVLPRAWAAEETRLQEELAEAVTDIVRDRVAIRRLGGASAVAGSPLAEAYWRQPIVGVCVISDGRITSANQRFCEIFGYTEAELRELPEMLDLFDGEDRGAVAQRLRRRVEGSAEAGPQLVRGRRKDGELVWLRAHETRVVLDGTPGVLQVAVDETPWRRTETELRRREEKLRLLLEAINDVTWEWEVRTGLLAWGEEAHRVLRYAPEEMVGTVDWWADRIHEEDRERVTARMQAVVGGRSSFWSDEYRFRRGDGSYAIVLDRGYLIRNERHVPLRMIGAMMDVSERRRGEDAQRFLARASVVLDGSLEPSIAFAELTRLIVPALADFCVLQLLPSDGVVSRSAAAHVRPDGEALLLGSVGAGEGELHPLLAEPIRLGQAILISSREAEGLERLGLSLAVAPWIEELNPRALIAAPFSFRDEVLGALVLGTSDSGRAFDAIDLLVARDLAHRIGMAVGGARLYEEARRAVQARDEILNMVTHDLRNPLSTIRMGVDLLTDFAPERRSDNRKWLEILRHSTEEMDGIIEDLVDLARIAGGRFVVDASHQNLPALLADTCRSFEALAEQSGLSFEYGAEEGLEGIWADARQIQRVFSNVVGNAFKFTPQGGRVTVRAEREGSMVRFMVRDTGPGIPPEHLPHVFDRYWQARQSDRRGIGLGLAIAKGIVEAHGGSIRAESVAGEGATFHFTIPMAASGPPGEQWYGEDRPGFVAIGAGI